MTDEIIDQNGLHNKKQIIAFLGWPWKQILKYYEHGDPPLPMKKEERNWQSDVLLLRDWKCLWLTGKVKVKKTPKKTP